MEKKEKDSMFTATQFDRLNLRPGNMCVLINITQDDSFCKYVDDDHHHHHHTATPMKDS